MNELNIKEAIKIASKKMKYIENPIKEAELILEFFLGKSRIFLHTNPNFEIENIDNYFNLIEQRVKNKPLEYITSSACFYGYDFYVNEDVLIPRPETEILIDKVKSIIEKTSNLNIIDVGCGSGVISITLAKYLSNTKITAIDISKKAIKVAKKNALRLNVMDKINFIESDLLNNINQKVDVIISNPPYIKNDELLKPNVKDYEPHLALFGGLLGYEILQRLIEEFFIRKCKYLFCEMACYQKEDIQKIINKHTYHSIEFYKDLSGLDRGFILKR